VSYTDLKESEDLVFMKKILILLAFGVILFTGGFIYFGQGAPKEIAPKILQEPETVVGGDRDEHGCIGSAGYSWCEAKAKCLRVWEEPCALDIGTTKTR
jgi:hypothetical protein